MIKHTYNRPFQLKGRDFEKMWRFLQADYAHKQERFIWHIGRLGDWQHGLWNEQKCITGYSGEANGLYEKLGPVRRKQWFHYELKLAVHAL